MSLEVWAECDMAFFSDRMAELTGGGDPARLEAVADLVLDCETGP